MEDYDAGMRGDEIKGSPKVLQLLKLQIILLTRDKNTRKQIQYSFSQLHSRSLSIPSLLGLTCWCCQSKFDYYSYKRNTFESGEHETSHFILLQIFGDDEGGIYRNQGEAGGVDLNIYFLE